LLSLLRNLGFADVFLVQRFDCFVGTSKEATARKYGVRGVNVVAFRP
jgi:hypothetical protein